MLLLPVSESVNSYSIDKTVFSIVCKVSKTGSNRIIICTVYIISKGRIGVLINYKSAASA